MCATLCLQVVLVLGFALLPRSAQLQLLQMLLSKCALGADLVVFCEGVPQLQTVKAVLWEYREQLLHWGHWWG